MATDTSPERLASLIQDPSEALNFEIKAWINPSQPDAIAKIAKAAMALFNRDGGYLLIGFDNDTLRPLASDRPADVRATFHPDIIQAIVSKYAYPTFEVTVAFPEREGLAFPLIAVPAGMRIPVACKNPLGYDGKQLLRRDAVYFRTLNANGVPSTSVAKAEDWGDIVEISFNNRETDIGRFLRRHLGSRELAQFFGVTESAPEPDLRDRVTRILEEQRANRDAWLSGALGDVISPTMTDWGDYEIAVALHPKRDAGTLIGRSFLNTIYAANPKLTGWPSWLDTQRALDEEKPRKSGNGYTYRIYRMGDGWRRIEYGWMADSGEFYLSRGLPDDLTEKVRPKTSFDPALMAYRIAETLAVALSFASALGYKDQAVMGCGIRWRGLAQRELSNWSNPMRLIMPGWRSVDEDAEGYVEIPSDTPPTALAPIVAELLRSATEAFDDFTMPPAAIENLVQRLIDRTG